MKWNLFLIMFAILTSVSGGNSYGKNVRSESESFQAKIIHIPLTSLRENDKFVVEARVDGASERVIFMRLYYKSKGEESFAYIEMSEDVSGYFAELSPARFSPPELQYFILALLADQSVITYPEWNPYGNPITVAIAAGPAAVKQPSVTQPIVPESLPSVSVPEKAMSTTPDSTDLGQASP
ncbi:MAG: hypothetical protein ACE5HX_09025, partial [bacterium]